MIRGSVLFYNAQKGFGFIQPDNFEKDVFVHATALERAGISGLQEGQEVKFDKGIDPRSGKTTVARIEIAQGTAIFAAKGSLRGADAPGAKMPGRLGMVRSHFHQEDTMPHEIKANDRVREQARKQVQDLNEFDYNAPAELFPGRNMKGGGRVKYKRFDTAAEALRFAVEEMPAPALLGACLEVDEARFGPQEIRYLYENAAYSLTRTAAG